MMHYIICTVLHNTLINKQKKKSCIAFHNHPDCSPFPLTGQPFITSSGYSTVGGVAIPTVPENPPLELVSFKFRDPSLYLYPSEKNAFTFCTIYEKVTHEGTKINNQPYGLHYCSD
jgi:hypothetical protein